MTNEFNLMTRFGRPLRPAQLGYPTVLPMLLAISDVVTLRGKQRTKRMVILNSAKAALESSISDDSSASNGMLTPRDSWKNKGGRLHTGGSGFKHGRHSEWNHTPKRRSAPPPPLFSPLNSPAFVQRTVDGNIFTFDRSTPLSPPVSASFFDKMFYKLTIN